MDSGDIKWLLAVADAGSLNKVAKARGVAVSTIARRIDAVEAHLQLRLLDRRRDGVRLTEDGQRLIETASAVVLDIDRLERMAATLRVRMTDRVIVSATEFVIAELLAPALPALFAAHPAIRIDLRAQGQVVSLAAREADIAIRMARPTGASLMAKKLPSIPLGFFASRDYLAGRAPDSIRIGDERLLGYDDSYGRIPELDALTGAGLAEALSVSTSSMRALVAAVTAGAGIALLPTRFAIRAGLVAVPGPPVSPRTPFIVVHRDVRRRPTIDAVHRWIAQAFAETARPPVQPGGAG